MLCRCWNVLRPKPSEAPVREGGASGKELLAVPASQRAGLYAEALPNFMKPPERSSAREAPPGGAPPPPPPKTSSSAAGATAQAKQDLDRAAEELLASIQADMVEEVEKV